MRYASVCSGVGVCKLAWPTWETAFFAEVAPFPSRVLAHHWPTVPNLGDITASDFIERAKAIIGPERLDVFAGGTPCQAFSFAGKRESLADARGNLSLRFVEIADAIDPRLVVWENVPGVLSTDDNAFGCFIGKLVGSSHPLRHGRTAGGWPYAGLVAGPRRTLAWRVVDAQYRHLAQRRERVLVVAGRVGDGTDPGAILFEPEVVRRDSPPRREARPQAARAVAVGAGIGSDELAHAVTFVIAHTLTGEGHDASEDGTGRGVPLVVCQHGEISHTLDTNCGSVTESCEGHGNGAPILAVAIRGRDGGRTAELGGEVASAMTTCSGGSNHPHILARSAVRRLTPRECERLQGMPDDHTNIPGAKDSPRYKAIGNAWARNVFSWLGDRIERELARDK